MLLLLLKEVYIFSNNVYGPWASHRSYCTVQRAQYDYQTNSLSLSPPSQKAQYHFHSSDKLPCNSLNNCKVQNSVLQWTYSLKNRICISISGNAWFAKFLAWLNGWTARLIGLGISNSSWRRVWWQNDRSEKASSHLLPSRLQRWCRSERQYLVRQFSERRWDGQVPSVEVPSSHYEKQQLTICCRTAPCAEVMTPPFPYTVHMTDYAQLLFSPGLLHNTAKSKKTTTSVLIFFDVVMAKP